MAFMLSDIRKHSDSVKFSYELLKPDGFEKIDNKYIQLYKSLGYLDVIEDNIQFKLSGLDELELSISRYTNDKNHILINNPMWDRVRSDYVIEISSNVSDNKQRFLITNIEKDSGSDGAIIKTIKAYSLEKEFENKMLRNYKSVDNTDIDIETTMQIDTIIQNILDKYMDNTWSIGYIDENVRSKYRSYDFSEGSVLKFFGELEESFCCLFKYDTINKEINVYDYTVYPVCPKCHKAEYLMFSGSILECYNPECTITDTDGNVITKEDGSKANWSTALYGGDSGLYLTERNYITQFTETEDIEEIATRLYVYGKDELQINTADGNYGGQSYLENFSYFRNENYMTDKLLKALNDYDELYESKKGVWKELNDRSWQLQRQLSDLDVISESQKSLLDDLNYEIESIKHLYSLEANSEERRASLKNIKDKIENILGIVEINDTLTEDEIKKVNKYLAKMNEELTYTQDPETKRCTITNDLSKVIDVSHALMDMLDDFEKEIGVIYKYADGSDRLEFISVEKINEYLETVGTTDFKMTDEETSYITEELKDYSFSQLDEAVNVYNERIKVLNTISQNVTSADLNSKLSTGESWNLFDKVYYNIGTKDIFTDTSKGISDWQTKCVKTLSNRDEFDAYIIPITYKKDGSSSYYYDKSKRYADDNLLVVYYQKYNKDTGKYEDMVLQTENAQYYVIYNESKRYYEIVQNRVDLTAILRNLEKSRDAKKLLVEICKHNIELNEQAIQELKLSLAKETCIDDNGNRIFPDELIKELNKYVKEKIYTNSDIGVADITESVGESEYRKRVNELYLDAQTAFYSMYMPTVTFDVDVINFLRDVKCQKDWDKLSLGDMVHIGHSISDNDDYIVRLIEMSFSPTDSSINLTFSNESKFKNNYDAINELMKSVNYTSTTLSVNKENWNNAESNAIDEILGNSFNAAITSVLAGSEQDVVTDKKGITIINTLDRDKQMRLMSGLLTFTDDNWSTTKTAITNGNVHAENIIGKLLAGKRLHIVATKADGSTFTFRVDGTGVHINNGGLFIDAMDDSLADSNGIEMSPEKGFVCTGFDEEAKKKIQIQISAVTDSENQEKDRNGLISIYTINKSGNLDKCIFKVEDNGDLLADGTIYAKDLRLGGINNQSVIDFIDATGISKGTDVNKVVYENGEYKIDGKVVKSALLGQNISCAGLKIKDGTKRFEVTSEAEVQIDNGSIELSNDKNTISINPDDGIVFTNGDETVIDLNITDGSATFSGTINTSKSCFIGNDLGIGYKDGSKGEILFYNSTGIDSSHLRGKISEYDENDDGRKGIEITGYNDIKLTPKNGHIYLDNVQVPWSGSYVSLYEYVRKVLTEG